MIDVYGLFFKVTIPGLVNIQELLGVTVRQGEPGTLDLYHKLVSF